MRQKPDFDDRHRDNSANLPGEIVLVYKAIRKIGLSGKLLHPGHGPYEVVHQLSPLDCVAGRPQGIIKPTPIENDAGVPKRRYPNRSR